MESDNGETDNFEEFLKESITHQNSSKLESFKFITLGHSLPHNCCRYELTDSAKTLKNLREIN